MAYGKVSNLIMLAISTALFLLIQDGEQASFTLTEEICQHRPNCPVNLDNQVQCREMSEETLQRHTSSYGLRDSLHLMLCERVKGSDGESHDFSNEFTSDTNNVDMTLEDQKGPCGSSVKANITLRPHFEDGIPRPAYISILDHGRLTFLNYTFGGGYYTVFIKLGLVPGTGRGVTIRVAVQGQHDFRLYQCFHRVRKECLNVSLYEECVSHAVTSPPPLPITPTTTTTTTTTTTLPPPTLTTTTTTTANPDIEAPPPDVTTMPEVDSTAMVTEPETSPAAAATSRKPRPTKPRPTQPLPTKPRSTRPSPTAKKPGKKRQENIYRDAFWKAVFMTVGVVAGVFFTAIVIFIVTKIKSHRRAKQTAKQEIQDNNLEVAHNPEGAMVMQDFDEAGYEVPVRKASEDLYHTIRDEDVQV